MKKNEKRKEEVNKIGVKGTITGRGKKKEGWDGKRD